MTSRPGRRRTLPLPGGRLASDSPLGWLRTSLAAGELLGPAAWSAARSAQQNPGEAIEAARQWGYRALQRLDVDLRLAGTEHIDPAEHYVVVALHEGFADVLALLRLPLPLAFVGRSELAEWRPLRKWMEATGTPPVDPERPVAGFRTLVREGRRRSEAGESIVVFPQGTILGIETAFHRGAFRLAALLDVPLLPVVLAGSHRVWEHPFSPMVRFGQPMYAEVLPPIQSSEAEVAMPLLQAQMKRIAIEQQFAPVRHFEPDRDGWWDGYAYKIDAAFPELAARVDRRRRSIGSAP